MAAKVLLFFDIRKFSIPHSHFFARNLAYIIFWCNFAAQNQLN